MITARVILFGIVLAQLADALTFTIGVSRFGIGLESNGVAAFLYGQAGLAGVLFAKGLVLLFTLALLISTVRQFPRLFMWGGAAATSFGLLGFAANSMSMALLSA